MADEPTYRLRRYTIVAPAVLNNGAMSGYPAALRAELLECGFNGWTEYETQGSWKGKLEPGTTFELYLNGGHGLAVALARIGARVMPDQEAIQVTYDPNPIALIEG